MVPRNSAGGSDPHSKLDAIQSFVGASATTKTSTMAVHAYVWLKNRRF